MLIGFRDQEALLVEELIERTEDEFTRTTGVTVNVVVIEDVMLDCNFGCQPVDGNVLSGEEFIDTSTVYDAMLLDGFTASTLRGRTANLAEFMEADVDYAVESVLENVLASVTFGSEIVAAPFAANSSTLMVNEALFDEVGVEVPSNLTWDEVAEVAQEFAANEAAGICMRATPGWDELAAPLTTIANEFGGAWWTASEGVVEPGAAPAIGDARINQTDSGFRDATEFVVGVLASAGPSDVTSFGFQECLNAFESGGVAMWFGSTHAVGFLELSESPQGSRGQYLPTPSLTNDRVASGWLDILGFVITGPPETRDRAWEFVSWATSEEYGDASNRTSSAPLSTREPPLDLDPISRGIIDSVRNARFEEPNAIPQPGYGGVHYVGVPVFQETANVCTSLFAQVIDGQATLSSALDQCQTVAADFTQ